MGQGARTIFAQIAADELGAPLDWVRVIMGDTAVVPFDLQTSASRSTVFMGNAILRACHDIHRQLRDMAAELHGVDAAEVTVADGMVCVPAGPRPIAKWCRPASAGSAVRSSGSARCARPTCPSTRSAATAAFYEFNCTAFEVEVDTETGEILIHKHVTVGDVGKALNPLQVAARTRARRSWASATR